MLRVIVAGVPEPSGSKVTGRWGGTHDANPRAADYRTTVANEVARAMRQHGIELIRKPAPVRLDVVFYRVRPSGHFRKDGSLAAGGLRLPFPITKPDRGKTLRTIEDALTGVLYEDDSQVVAGEVTKAWGETAYAELTIRTWEAAWFDDELGRWSDWP